MTDFPSYVRLHEEGVLGDRLEQILGLASPCMLCPRQCMVDRTTGDRGYCQAPYGLYVSSASPHFGEEGPLVGTGGSGTIFMTHCNLRCVFCQNHDISIRGEGVSCSAAALADGGQITFVHFPDEAVGVDQLCRGHRFLLACLRPGVAQVVQHGA